MSIQFLTWISTYVLIVLAELGDKTQVAVLMIASSNPRQRWLVLGASALALVACVTIEVTVGATLAQYLGPALINRIAGWVFLIIGVVMLISHYRETHPSNTAEGTQSGHLINGVE